MHKQHIAPAALIFLCGIGVGFSLFPHIMPQAVQQQPVYSAGPVIQEPTPQEHAEAFIPHEDPIAIPTLPEQKPLTNTDQESYILQLFSPTSSQVNEMQTESEQMKLLEQTMMISYLLSNCDRMKKSDYDKTYIAMVKYLTNSGDPNPRATARDAANRARASYQMVYRHISCDDPSLYKMAESLAEWRNSVDLIP